MVSLLTTVFFFSYLLISGIALATLTGCQRFESCQSGFFLTSHF